jgi:hypothetical protein
MDNSGTFCPNNIIIMQKRLEPRWLVVIISSKVVLTRALKSGKFHKQARNMSNSFWVQKIIRESFAYLLSHHEP